MSDQYTPMIERISEEYDESDSNMVLELAATNQEYADLKQQMSELKHQYPFIEKLLEGDGEVQLTDQEHEILNQYFRLYLRADNMERKHIYFRGHTDCFPIWRKLEHSKKNSPFGGMEKSIPLLYTPFLCCNKTCFQYKFLRIKNIRLFFIRF